MLDTSLDLALAFLKAHPDWYIFPIRRLEKEPPLIKDNLTLATNDPKQIRDWHTRWRGCNWGLALRKSKVIVMDVDRKAGKVGQQTLDNLTLEYGELPETLTVMTPSGGLHIYFLGEHRFGLGKYGFGPDVDSTNYVLIPGCWLCTNSEQGYEIIKEAPVAPAPDWFGVFLKEKSAKEAAADDPATDLDKPANVERMIRYLREGAPPSIQFQGGEKALFDVSCVLKDNAISEYKAIELLIEHYNVSGRCEPLWMVGEGPDADRLEVKVHNAWLYARENQAGSATAEFAFGDPGDKIDPEEVESLAAAWTVRVAAQQKQKAADRDAKMFTDEARGIDPLTGEPFDDDDPDDDDPTGEDAPRSADEKIDAQGDAAGTPKSAQDLKWIAANWVWVVSAERFVRLGDGLMWSRTQFDSYYNHLSNTSSVSGAIFKTAGRIRRLEKLCYRPGQGIVCDNGRTVNLWRPSAVVPKEGDTTLWDEHLNYLFQNPEDKSHVLNWLAWVYQNPQRKPNHALLLVGKNTGTGKSFIARVMEYLIGPENTQRPKNSSLKGDFNAWALKCKLCIIEELMQIGRREVANELRDIITESTIEVNIKNVNTQKVENYMAMMAITNHQDAMPLEDTDRRWLVVETYVTRLDGAYYRRLFAILNNPSALAAIAYSLKRRDVGEYDASLTAPETEAKQQMIRLSRSDVETWLIDNLGNAPLSRTIICTQDIVEAMPATMQRTPRLASSTIPNFLRDRARGERLGVFRLSDGRRLPLWGLHGKSFVLRQASPSTISTMYETERKQGAQSAEEQAADDFGEEG